MPTGPLDRKDLQSMVGPRDNVAGSYDEGQYKKALSKSMPGTDRDNRGLFKSHRETTKSPLPLTYTDSIYEYESREHILRESIRMRQKSELKSEIEENEA